MPAFFNQATLSYSGGTVNSNITTGEIVEVLSASKTAVSESYTQGSDITYAINIINSGPVALSGLTLTDDLSAYTFEENVVRPLDYVEGSVTYFVNGILQVDPPVTVEESLVVTGISVPADSVATILYTARANAFASPLPDGSIMNTAVISGEGVTAVTVTETVQTEEGPRLSITKSVSPTTVTENSEITYTFVIQNSGNAPAVATDNVIVTDTFDPLLSNITVTYNGALWTEPTDYTYDETTGVFTTVLGAITVPAATFTQDPENGNWVVDPSAVVITVTGTI